MITVLSLWKKEVERLPESPLRNPENPPCPFVDICRVDTGTFTLARAMAGRAKADNISEELYVGEREVN